MPKSFAQQIEDDENKIKRIREHQRMVRAKQAKQERNARTKRLVETGAIVEKARGGAYDDEGRQTFSDGLNGIISVYDPSRGGNVDMRVIDVIDRRSPRSAGLKYLTWFVTYFRHVGNMSYHRCYEY